MPELKPSPVLLFPQLALADDLESALPLELTTVNAQVTGPVASVAVTQRFGNPLKEPAELEYLFPLPEDAAIMAFELHVGERRITGDLQEREAARASYTEALEQGRRGGLVEQRRPNLFAVRLANVQPGEVIQAVLRYQQPVKFAEDAEGGFYEFVYPMGLTPKYDRPEEPGEGEGTHAPVAKGGETIGPVEVTLSIDAGLPVGEPRSPSHPIEITRLDDRRLQVRLAGQHIPDHDFVLRYPAAGETISAAGWTSGQPGKEYFLATLLPPLLTEPVEALPREFLFVLDRSGSMSGEPIRQARNALRACLRALAHTDTFNVLLFDNVLEWFQQEPVPVTQEQVDRADHYLETVQGRGGTEILRALEAALSLKPDPARTRFIVFLTDGAVSAELRVLESIRARLGVARLFTFGIGSSVNRALLNRMAQLGRGRSEFLQLDEDIEGAVIRFQDSVSFPALTDLVLEWAHGKAWDVYPTRLPDLYYGQPLEIRGRLSHSGDQPVSLTLRGKRGGQPVAVKLTMPVPTAADPAVERLWARARVDELLDQLQMEPGSAAKIRAELVGLALEHNLVTAYTSFVALDQEPAGEHSAQPRVIHVAQPLPQGVQMGGVGAPGPQMPVLSAMMSPSPTRARTINETVSFESDSEPQSFMSKTMQRVSSADQPVKPVRGKAATADQHAPQHGQNVLRWLARTQNVDGSWQADVEQTAAALLAFVRAGNTTRKGSYRQVLRRAAAWLAEHPGQGLASFLSARALMELADATGSPSDRTAAEAAAQLLPQPASRLESAALGQPGAEPPAEIVTFDDLRAAALLRTVRPIPENLLTGDQADLARVWAAVMQPA